MRNSRSANHRKQSRDQGVVTEGIPYDPLPSQLAFHRSASAFKGFSGPVGSGKSAALCHEAVRQATANVGCIGLLAAPTFGMLKDATQEMLFSMLDFEDVVYRYNKAEQSVLLEKFRSKILLRSLDRPERLRGTNLAWFGLDELSYVKEDSWLRMTARLRDPNAKRLCGFAVWTPKGHDWVHQRFIGEPANEYSCVRAEPFENRFVLAGAPDYYERLKSVYDKNFYKQEVHGEYLNVREDRVYHEFRREDHVGSFNYDPSKKLLWSLDFNVNPMSSVIAQQNGEYLHVIDEISLNLATTDQAGDEFAARYGGHHAGIEIFGDASGNARKTVGKSDYDLLNQTLVKRGVKHFHKKVPSRNPPVSRRVAKVNAILKNAQRDIRIQIHRCKEVIKEEVTYKAGTAVVDKDSDPRRTHMSDALGYLIWSLSGEQSPFGELSTPLYF
jgi:Terminase large subunit, T4likevirus-type, N-terminal